MSAAHLISNRGPPTSAGQGTVSAIIVIHSYWPGKTLRRLPARLASRMIDPRTALPRRDLVLLDLGRDNGTRNKSSWTSVKRLSGGPYG